MTAPMTISTRRAFQSPPRRAIVRADQNLHLLRELVIERPGISLQDAAKALADDRRCTWRNHAAALKSSSQSGAFRRARLVCRLDGRIQRLWTWEQVSLTGEKS